MKVFVLLICTFFFFTEIYAQQVFLKYTSRTDHLEVTVNNYPGSLRTPGLWEIATQFDNTSRVTKESGTIYNGSATTLFNCSELGGGRYILKGTYRSDEGEFSIEIPFQIKGRKSSRSIRYAENAGQVDARWEEVFPFMEFSFSPTIEYLRGKPYVVFALPGGTSSWNICLRRFEENRCLKIANNQQETAYILVKGLDEGMYWIEGETAGNRFGEFIRLTYLNNTYIASKTGF